MLSGTGPMVGTLPDGMSVEDVLQAIDTSGDGVIQLSELRQYIQQEQVSTHRRNTQEIDRDAFNDMMKWNKEEGKKGSGDSPTAARNMFSSRRRGSGDSSNELSDDAPLWPIFAKIGVLLCQEPPTLPPSAVLPNFELECERHAQRLVEQHWLLTVGDLRNLEDVDWPYLGLPMKLQIMLKERI